MSFYSEPPFEEPPDNPDDWLEEYEAWLASQAFDEDAYIAWMDEMSAREEMPEADNGRA